MAGSGLDMVRQILSAILPLLLFVSLISPTYHVHVNVSDTHTASYLYNFLYTYRTSHGLQLWVYNSDNLPVIALFGVTFFSTLYGIISFGMTWAGWNHGGIIQYLSTIFCLIGVLAFLFVPFAAPVCEIPSYEGDTSETPCTNLYGRIGNASWGPFIGWDLLALSTVVSFALLVVSLMAPPPLRSSFHSHQKIKNYEDIDL